MARKLQQPMPLRQPWRRQGGYGVYNIEHWSLLFGLEILPAAVFRGKFAGSEALD